MTRAELEIERAKLIAELAPGGSQAHCESLRRKIAEVERALAHVDGDVRESPQKGKRYE
jgi:hypothetical protein